MQGKMSRCSMFAGLVPGAWVVLLQKEEPSPGVRYNYRGIHLHMEADASNTHDVEYLAQDSQDGITWTTRAAAIDPIVPGGMVFASVMGLGPHIRVLLFSQGHGRVDATVGLPEDQASVSMWPDVGSSLACASYCEVSDES